MQIDQTTLYDLSIFHADETQSVFHHLNHTQTANGRMLLAEILSHPLDSVSAIKEVQDTIRTLQAHGDMIPQTITNGTLMVIEKFFETGLDALPSHPNAINTFLYQLFSKPDFSLAKYSVNHFATFIRGMKRIETILLEAEGKQLRTWGERVSMLLRPATIQELLNGAFIISPSNILRYAYFLQKEYKNKCRELIELYSKIDAYRSLAICSNLHGYHFPEVCNNDTPSIHIEGLYHPLLQSPVAYTTSLDKEQNFLFLTGANMAGKSTLIKAIGISVYLAHIGMAVPASKMKISYLDGLLSNIQVTDNIVKGESYFYNEVQRIKQTIEKISDGNKWLILIDELFKGTNVQDAMKCSTVVIEGFCRMPKALFVLSTHLYEIGYALQAQRNIQFRYFETAVENNELQFSYQLKEGISNDRLGYLIMEREGVVELLKGKFDNLII